jgi:hypothetical protein
VFARDLFPESIRAKLKNSFRGYLDAELEAIKALPDVCAAKRAHSRSSAFKLDIQNQVMVACQNPGS